MTAIVDDNTGFIECWNGILTPKWIRCRHVLSGNGKIHSDLAFPIFDIQRSNSVLDIGCGFGETCLQMAEFDADICIGRTAEEAIAYQTLVGSSGEIIREAGPGGERHLPKIREALTQLLTPYLRDDGVFMPSSTWAIMARKPGQASRGLR